MSTFDWACEDCGEGHKLLTRVDDCLICIGCWRERKRKEGFAVKRWAMRERDAARRG